MHEPYKWAVYTMDKAYVDFEALYRMHLNETYFVTRPKDTMRYEVVETNHNINEMAGIVSDRTIRLTGTVTARKYPDDLRMAKFHDTENDEVISFITNNLELGPLVIANIYRNRWAIETCTNGSRGT